MKKALIITMMVIMLTVGVAGSAVYAAGKRGHNKGGLGEVISTVMDIVDGLRTLKTDVNLTATQKESIKNILIAAKPQAQELHKQLNDQRHQLRDALLATNPNQADIQSLSQKLADGNAQMVTLRIQTVQKITEQLTPAQKSVALKDLMAIDPLIDELKDELEDLAMKNSLKN